MDKELLAKWIIRADKNLTSIVRVACVVLLAIIVITVSVSIFTRFIFFTPINFTDSLSKYLMIWLSFLGIGLGIRENEHIAVDMFVGKLTGKAKSALLILSDVIVSLFLLFIIYYGFVFAFNGSGTHDTLLFGVSMTIPYIALAVGAVYAFVQLNIITLLNLLGVEKK